MLCFVVLFSQSHSGVAKYADVSCKECSILFHVTDVLPFGFCSDLQPGKGQVKAGS